MSWLALIWIGRMVQRFQAPDDQPFAAA